MKTLKNDCSILVVQFLVLLKSFKSLIDSISFDDKSELQKSPDYWKEE